MLSVILLSTLILLSIVSVIRHLICGNNLNWLLNLNLIYETLWTGVRSGFLIVNDLPGDVICDIAIYADDITLYCKCDQAPDLWQQLELASEFQSDLRDTVDWGKR